MRSAAAISRMVACAPLSSISRQRNARAIALTVALLTCRLTGGGGASTPSGASTSLRPPRFRIEIGTRTVTVRVPISIRKRGGRRLVLAPDGVEAPPPPVKRHVNNATVKAIARAFRWREMLESGAHATIREIAAAERINETYVGRT